MALFCFQACVFLCVQIACAQVLKFTLRWESSPISHQNSTPGAVELAYRYTNQFKWTMVNSFQVESCPCGPPVPSSACGDTFINLASFGVDVTRPVQFRWLQRGPPSPHVWSVDAISFRGSIYDDFDDQLHPNKERWCDTSGGVIAASNCSVAPPHQRSLRFFSGYARRAVGAMTPLLVISGLVIILHPCREDLDVLELLKTPIDETDCSDDAGRAQIQVGFALFIGPSNGSLGAQDTVRLSMRENTSSSWIPLLLYASGMLNYPGCGPDVCRIAAEGYNVSVKTNRSMAYSPVPIQISVCGRNTQLQFMWSGGNGSKIDWALGNLSFAVQYPSKCILLSDIFYASDQIEDVLQEVRGGAVRGQMAVFPASNSSKSAVSFPIQLTCPAAIPQNSSFQSCPEEVVFDYHWPVTAAGANATGYCIKGKYIASRRCSQHTAWSAQWESVTCSSPVNIINPDLAVEDLRTLSLDLEVSETLNLMQALTKVVGNYSASEVFGQRFVTIASNLVGRTMKESQLMRNLDGSEFLQTLDHFALWNLNVIKNITTIATTNIVLNITSVGNDLQQPLSAILCGENSITLPRYLFSIPQQKDQVRVVAYCYSNISLALHDPISNPVMGLPILSAALNCTTSTGTCQMNYTRDPVVIVFDHPDLKLLGRNYSTECAYWHFTRTGNGSVSGHWSHDGCVKNTSLSSSTRTVCFCYHLTHFAILLSPGVELLSKSDDKALYVIEAVGVVISLIALAATVFTYALLRPLWSLRSFVHVNLCISLFVSQLLLLGAEWVEGKLLCAAVAVVLQYLFLVVFMWMLMEGVVLYLALVVVFMSSNSKYMTLFAFLSYGLPAAYLSVIAPVGFLVTDKAGGWQYGTSQSCWLRYDTHFVWSFIAPVLLILLANAFVFIMSMSIMWHHHHSKTRAVDTKHWLRVSLSLTAVLGFTWVFGVLYFNKYLVFFAYIFTICNTLQGLFIFIFIVMLSKQVRDEYRRWWENIVVKFGYLHKHSHPLPRHVLADTVCASKCNEKTNKARTMSTTTTRSYPDRHMSVTEVLEDPSPRRRSTLGSIGYDIDMEVFEIGTPN